MVRRTFRHLYRLRCFLSLSNSVWNRLQPDSLAAPDLEREGSQGMGNAGCHAEHPSRSLF